MTSFAPWIDTAKFSVRMADDEIVEVAAWQLSTALLAGSRPFRTFRWYKGQQHYSGTYWSATESAHVIYESRLELSRLLLADFDPAVTRIYAQPLMIRAKVDGTWRRHTPDFLLVKGKALEFVAVKPLRRLEDPKVVATFEWVREVVESSGWSFEVVCEPLRPYVDNVRFLAGYRRAQLIAPSALTELRALELDGAMFGEVLRGSDEREPRLRAALLHMLWSHELETDLSQVLGEKTVLARGGSK